MTLHRLLRRMPAIRVDAPEGVTSQVWLAHIVRQATLKALAAAPQPPSAATADAPTLMLPGPRREATQWNQD